MEQLRVRLRHLTTWGQAGKGTLERNLMVNPSGLAKAREKKGEVSGRGNGMNGGLEGEGTAPGLLREAENPRPLKHRDVA